MTDDSLEFLEQMGQPDDSLPECEWMHAFGKKRAEYHLTYPDGSQVCLCAKHYLFVRKLHDGKDWHRFQIVRL